MYTVILSSLPIAPVIASHSEDNDYFAQEYIDVQPMATIPSWIKRALISTLINVAKQIPISNNPGTVYEYSDHALVYHNSVTFNSGGIGSAVEKKLNAYGRDVIRPYLQRNQLIPGVKGYINILWNGRLVSTNTVSSGQTVSYTVPGSAGTQQNINVHYGATEKSAWYPRMFYIPYKDRGPVVPTSLSSSSDSFYLEYEDKILIKNVNRNRNNSHSEKKSYTMEELYMEFYNDELKMLSNQATTLAAGSTVYLNDVITYLEYDRENNKTIFHFTADIAENINSHELHFNGDLTGSYFPGDKLNLLFNVHPLTEDRKFIDLDYNINFSKSGKLPSIDQFLITN